jgi:hypothetical protein
MPLKAVAGSFVGPKKECSPDYIVICTSMMASGFTQIKAGVMSHLTLGPPVTGA